jgi:hypothetical protein
MYEHLFLWKFDVGCPFLCDKSDVPVEDLRNVPNCSSKCVSVSEKGGVIRFSCQLVWNECHISNGLVRWDAVYLDKAAETFEEYCCLFFR